MSANLLKYLSSPHSKRKLGLLSRKIILNFIIFAGTRFSSNKQVSTSVDAFLGVPYAAPPVGPLRFLPPASTGPWTGTRMAITLPPACPQQMPSILSNRYWILIIACSCSCEKRKIYKRALLKATSIALKSPLPTTLEGRWLRSMCDGPYTLSIYTQEGLLFGWASLPHHIRSLYSGCAAAKSFFFIKYLLFNCHKLLCNTNIKKIPWGNII